MALFIHSNKQSTFSAVLLEKPRNCLCSFAANSTVYEQPSKLSLSHKNFLSLKVKQTLYGPGEFLKSPGG
jgi:hypothetical protein